MSREIAFDTETTGLDPFSGHRIIEIGCVELIDKIRTGRSFQAYINPEREVPAEAERVHGISTAMLIGKPVFAEIVEEFLEFIADSPLVIHNAGFDMKFINYELERLGFKPLPASRAIDTVTMARRKFPGAPANLDALCRRFNIDLSARDKHGALLDSELLSDVYLELCGGRQGMISFESAGKSSLAQDITAVAVEITPRFFPVSAEELAAHEAFVDTLKKPMWKLAEA